MKFARVATEHGTRDDASPSAVHTLVLSSTPAPDDDKRLTKLDKDLKRVTKSAPEWLRREKPPLVLIEKVAAPGICVNSIDESQCYKNGHRVIHKTVHTHLGKVRLLPGAEEIGRAHV